MARYRITENVGSVEYRCRNCGYLLAEGQGLEYTTPAPLTTKIPGLRERMTRHDCEHIRRGGGEEIPLMVHRIGANWVAD